MNPKLAFPVTRWSLVAASQRNDAPHAQAALADLCREYYYPVFAEVRRLAPSFEDAEDRTQDFFQHILEKRTFAKADRDRGKFRTFILACLKNFLANQHERYMAQKRAPQRAVASFDAMQAEERLRAEPQDHRSPDLLFMRRYGSALLEASREELRKECSADGNAAAFDLLGDYLTRADPDPLTQGDLATRLGVPRSHVKAMLQRMRERFGEIIDRRIADTLHHPSRSEIRAERDALYRCFNE